MAFSRGETADQRNLRIFQSHLSKVIFDNDCWIWVGAHYKREIGPRMNRMLRHIPYFVARRPDGSYHGVYARRWIWEHNNGKLREDQQVRNVCDNEWCVNPGRGHNEVSSKHDGVPRVTITQFNYSQLTNRITELEAKLQGFIIEPRPYLKRAARQILLEGDLPYNDLEAAKKHADGAREVKREEKSATHIPSEEEFLNGE